jgi:hypothetical protein
MAIVNVTPELLAKALASTDWQAIDARSDGDIALNVAQDPDAPPILTVGETAAAMARTVRKRLGLSQAGTGVEPTPPVSNGA